jgi:glycosyltransferase involved in cell wall biosynthesis
MSKEIIWYAPLYDPSGYASCAREYVFSLYNLGAKIRVEPIAYWSMIRGALTQEQEELLKALENTPVSKYSTRVQHMVPDCYHQDKYFRDRRLNVGYTVFETDSLPESWLPKMEMMDSVFVPTAFNVKTFANGGFDPNKMVTIPHIVNTDKADPSKYDKMPIPIKKDFYFLTIMDFTKRKGWDILLKAYLREFQGNKDVGLIFKAYFGGVTEVHKKNLIKRITDFKDSLHIKNAPDIIFFGDVLEEPNLYRLYNTADCFVYPSRGEGWGLCISEAMAMEVPVITTNWSGQLEFCKPNNSYLVDVLNFEETDEEMLKITPNYKNQKWAVPSEHHLRQTMRHVYENRNEEKEKAKVGRHFLKTNFNWKVVGQKILDNIL